MNSGPDLPIACYADPDAMPADARALFGTALGDSAAWYRAVVAAAQPPGAVAAFVVVGAPAQAVFPMRREGRRLSALTTPYTCLWSPLTRDGSDLAAAGRALGAWCAGRATVRLDALDLADPRWEPLRHGLRLAGLRPLPFDHFGTWRIAVAGLDYAAYVAARPGALRATLRRRGARLAADGARLRLVAGGDGLEAGVAAYESVYARSWKVAEPYPTFNATLMRACAADGSLRLGLLEQADATLAAQFWVVRDGLATVLKLAHDVAHGAASPGTVLTGMMIRHLIEQDRVRMLDFGRGDDAYKSAWTDTRLQRSGLILANPRRALGLAASGQKFFASFFQKRRTSFLKKRSKKLLLV